MSLMIKIQNYARAKLHSKKKIRRISCWKMNLKETPSADCRTTLQDFTTFDYRPGSINGNRLLLTWSTESYLLGNLLSIGEPTGFTSWKPLFKIGFIKLDVMRPRLRFGRQKLLGTSRITKINLNSSSIMIMQRSCHKRSLYRMRRQAYMGPEPSMCFHQSSEKTTSTTTNQISATFSVYG